MDALTFIEKIAASVAWPVTVLVLALAFRRSVVQLLPRLLELKSGRLSIKLAEQKLTEAMTSPLEDPVEIRAPVTVRLPPPKSAGQIKTKELDPSRYQNQRTVEHTDSPKTTGSGSDPLTQVDGSWHKLVATVTHLAQNQGINTASASRAVERLREGGFVPAAFAATFEKVKHSRMALKKAPWLVERKHVLEFAENCTRLEEFVRQLLSLR